MSDITQAASRKQEGECSLQAFGGVEDAQAGWEEGYVKESAIQPLPSSRNTLLTHWKVAFDLGTPMVSQADPQTDDTALECFTLLDPHGGHLV